tara:strand:- start:3675 stop:4895 length:1221 start_codon:yes stop_codon:yes gene_type:complete
MYNLLLALLKKYFPTLYKFLKKVKNRLLFGKKFITSKNFETIDLIKSVEKESFFDFQKREFFKNKDKKSKTGILEINNSCNINCVMCDTKSSSRQKKLMDLDICEKSVKQMKESGVTSVLLHTIGDPLANAKLKDYLKILRKYNLQAGLSTNALLLDKHVETLREYFDICSNIRFSIDGVRKETYEKIRFGGKFEKLIENLELAQKQLRSRGFEFMIDLVITKDNFDELGEFVVFYKKYINNPYKNMHFSFMNSLAPDNDYFLKNNTLEQHTSKNFYCGFASNLTPYVLVDGRVSACCRDYDGSLVVDDIKNNKIEIMPSSNGFKNLQKAHMDENGKIDDYKLCKSCYTVDKRVNQIWDNIISTTLYKYPNKDGKFYQDIFDDTLVFLKDLNSSNYQKLKDKHLLN